MSILAEECYVCGKLHKSESEEYFSIAGKIWKGPPNEEGVGKQPIVYSSEGPITVCRSPECILGLLGVNYREKRSLSFLEAGEGDVVGIPGRKLEKRASPNAEDSKM